MVKHAKAIKRPKRRHVTTIFPFTLSYGREIDIIYTKYTLPNLKHILGIFFIQYNFFFKQDLKSFLHFL